MKSLDSRETSTVRTSKSIIPVGFRSVWEW